MEILKLLMNGCSRSRWGQGCATDPSHKRQSFPLPAASSQTELLLALCSYSSTSRLCLGTTQSNLELRFLNPCLWPARSHSSVMRYSIPGAVPCVCSTLVAGHSAWVPESGPHLCRTGRKLGLRGLPVTFSFCGFFFPTEEWAQHPKERKQERAGTSAAAYLSTVLGKDPKMLWEK